MKRWKGRRGGEKERLTVNEDAGNGLRGKKGVGWKKVGMENAKEEERQ